MKLSIDLFVRPGNLARSAALAAACLAWASTSALGQFRPVLRHDLPDLDNRAPATPGSARLTERQGGQARLADRLSSAIVDFDPLLDTPEFIRARDGFLTGPNGQGRAVSALVLQALPASDPYRPIKAFVNEYSALFGHGAEVLNTARVKRDYVDAHNGLHTVVWEQQLEGIPVFQSLLVGHITRNGELTSLSSRFLPGLAAAADNGTPGRAALESAPPVSASQAILLAGQNIGAGLTAANIVPAGPPVADGDYLPYKTPEQASVRLVWFPLHRSALRLAWEVLVTQPATHEAFQLVIDAQTGNTHWRRNLTCHISDATYSVYDSYSPSPMGPGLQTPGGFQPPLTNRTVITTPALDTIASPDGWIPDGANTTTGNNIDAFVDRNGDEQPDQPRPQGNPNRVFNFALDLTQDPKTYIDASTVQLFWRANWYHDRMYEQGFTEAAGNFQDNNFGRGGLGNDHIICFVQAGADVGIADNSMFAPAPDGQSGRCYMFIFSGPTPNRDGSLDSEVVTHELTHGTSWRLVGGGGMVLGSLQGNGLGEGWSDFYAEVLLNPNGANPDAAYAMGGYVTYLIGGSGFNQNYYYGIRRYPYSTDLSKNPLTFKDIDPGQASAHTGVPLSPLFSPFDPASADEVHNQGEVWCVTLWEMHANLVHKYGWALGNELTLRLTTDGMKLTPPFPNFLQARDAIILADTINNGGANFSEIWTAFAKRGMGYTATSPGGSTTAGVHEAFDTPPFSSVWLRVDSFRIAAGNGNGVMDPNECNSLFITLTNFGTVGATNIRATVTTTTPGVLVTVHSSGYPNIPPGSLATNTIAFQLNTSPSFICGTPVEVQLDVKCDQGTVTASLTLPSGSIGETVRFDNDSVVAIPDGDVRGTNSIVVVSNITTALKKVTVSLYITHPYDGDLILQLVSPGGITNTLAAHRGANGQNFGVGCSPDAQRTTFDDDALVAIGASPPPFIGSFKPDQPLAVFTGLGGTNVNGPWLLHLVDDLRVFAGELDCWSLSLTPARCLDGGGECPGADLALGMTAAPEPVVVGNYLTYSLAVTNNGPRAANSVSVSQVLPGSTVFVSATTSQGGYSQAGGVVTCNLGPLLPGQWATISVVVLPTTAGPILSSATAASEQQDFDLSNNGATALSHVVAPTADLAVTMLAAPNPVVVGATLTYSVSVANNGPSTATGVTVTNVLPLTVAVVSAGVSQGSATVLGNVVVCNLGSLASGGHASASIQVIPVLEGGLTATATVTGLQIDPVPGNNTATVGTTVGPAADLAISLMDYPDPVITRSNLTYQITVSNLGPSTATSVVVNQTLPGAVTLVSSNATQGTLSLNGSTLTCAVGTLAKGARTVITVTVVCPTSGSLTTSASATGTELDPYLGNNTASTTTLVAPPFLAVAPAGATLTAESFFPTNGAIEIGETVTLDLRLRNVGNVILTNVTSTLLATGGVTPLPPTTRTNGVLPLSGYPVGRSFTFTAGGTNGGTVVATLHVKAGPTDLTNVTFSFALPTVATFASTNVVEILDVTNALPYPSTISVSGLAGIVGKVTATLSNLNHTYAPDIDALLVGPAPPGQSAKDTILMSGAGAGEVHANVTFDDSAASPVPAADTSPILSGSYQPANYTGLNLPSPAPTGPYPATLSALNGGSANGPWSLWVADHSSGDTGSISGGWSLTLTTINPVNQTADLGMTGTATPNPILAGDTLTYTFIVTNNGPNLANVVTFTNVLPAGVTLLAAGTSQGILQTNSGAVFGSLGALNTGAVATVTVVVQPGAAAVGSLTNTACVSAYEIDLDPGNNLTAVATTVILPVADIAVSQVAAPNPVFVGSNLTFTLTVTNYGPSTALAVTLTNPLPAGLTVVATNTTQGTCTNLGGTLVCQLGNVASAGSATVTVVATNSIAGQITNTAYVTTASFETVTNNNSTTAIVTVSNLAPLILSAGAILKSESGPVNGMVDPGETVVVSLSLANTGSVDTVNLKAGLQASGGVTPLSGPQSYGILVRGGPSAARDFTFTAGAPVGGVFIATLQLQDERPGVTNDLGAVSFVFSPPPTAAAANTGAISIPDHGAALPYPSTINVSGLTGWVGAVTVTLNGLSHRFPSDLNVLLVSPAGTNVLLMSHAGAGYAITNITLTFDDGAGGLLPKGGPLTAGAYQPSAYGTVVFPGPAPAAPYGSVLSASKWTNPNGAWSLYVFDDAMGDAGTVAGGWSLNITTVTPLNPVVDVAVGLSSTSPSLFVGVGVTNTISVTNLGPMTATAVSVTQTLPADVAFVSAHPSQGSFIGTNAGLVTCDLGSLAARATATVTIVTLPSVAGSITYTANAIDTAPSDEDLNPTNNSAQITVSVSAPAPARLVGSMENGQFHLTVIAQPGFVYVIQASSNLTSWVPISTNTASVLGVINYTDTAPGFNARYYRTVH